MKTHLKEKAYIIRKNPHTLQGLVSAIPGQLIFQLLQEKAVTYFIYCTLITVTKNLFSSSSCIAPLMDPIAQHNQEKTSVSLNYPWCCSTLKGIQSDLHSQTEKYQSGCGYFYLERFKIRSNADKTVNVYRIQIFPRPFSTIDLSLQFFSHMCFCVLIVQMCQIYC